MKKRIGLVDDHQLFLKSLALMIESFNDYEVVVEALNGKDLRDKLAGLSQLPDMIIIDVNMPVMDGIETATWLTAHHPGISLIALSMNDKDQSIINMFRAGCTAYMMKDIHPAELEKALQEVSTRGYYNADTGNLNFRRLLQKADEKQELKLTARELQFLKLACTEFTYKQIADKLGLSERTIDGYRESLFQKFNVQSRVGLCLEALRREFVSL